MMQKINTPLEGLKVIEPIFYQDTRGFFFESFNQQLFCKALGREVSFVQDNHSQSNKGVLRGLHYQVPPHAQGKLVRVIVGEIFDITVDIRPQSATFGQWYSIHLSAENKRQIWIPEGFAHGFQALSVTAEVTYKTTDYWDVNAERTLRWDDPDIGIVWPLASTVILSAKDQQGLSLKDL